MKTVLRVISMIVLTLGIIVLGYIMCVRLFGVDTASRLFEVTMQESEEPWHPASITTISSTR